MPAQAVGNGPKSVNEAKCTNDHEWNERNERSRRRRAKGEGEIEWVAARSLLFFFFFAPTTTFLPLFHIPYFNSTVTDTSTITR